MRLYLLFYLQNHLSIVYLTKHNSLKWKQYLIFSKKKHNIVYCLSYLILFNVIQRPKVELMDKSIDLNPFTRSNIFSLVLVMILCQI